MNTIRKVACPSKVMDALFQEGFRTLHDDKISHQAFAPFYQKPMDESCDLSKRANTLRYLAFLSGSVEKHPKTGGWPAVRKIRSG